MIERHVEEAFGLEAFEEQETFEAHVEAAAEQAAFQEAQEATGPEFPIEWREAA